MSKPKITIEFNLSPSRITKISLSLADRFQYRFTTLEKNKELEDLIHSWMDSYLSGKEAPFLPLEDLQCPAFTKSALQEIQKVSFGQKATYQEIAKRVKNPKASRAVGNVCRYNPFPLVIPCHRIVGANGDLGGFAFGTEMKKNLLDFEELTGRRI